MWETAPGLYGWLASVDHKQIGIRYIVTAFVFLILGGIEALIFRLQLSWSNLHLLTPEQYDQLFTVHGMTMIFLYAGPVLSGFSNYLWPLLLGARDMALPRLNALSYWIYLAAGIVLYSGFAVGFGPDAGWFNYVPLAARAYNDGPTSMSIPWGWCFWASPPRWARSISWSLSCGCAAPACRSTGCRSWSGAL